MTFADDCVVHPTAVHVRTTAIITLVFGFLLFWCKNAWTRGCSSRRPLSRGVIGSDKPIVDYSYKLNLLDHLIGVSLIIGRCGRWSDLMQCVVW
jgi:hypothetical protein